VSNSYR